MSDPVFKQGEIVIHVDQGRGVVTGEPSDTGIVWCDFERSGQFGADPSKLRHAGKLARWSAHLLTPESDNG